MNRNEFETEIGRKDTLLKASGMIRKICGADQVEDILQEAKLHAWRGIAKFKGDSLFSTWFYAIARNVALMHARKQKRLEKKAPLEDVVDDRSDDDSEARIALKQVINRASNRLNPNYKEALHASLTEVDDTHAAVKIGIPVKTYRVRLHHARRILKESVDVTDI